MRDSEESCWLFYLLGGINAVLLVGSFIQFTRITYHEIKQSNQKNEKNKLNERSSLVQNRNSNNVNNNHHHQIQQNNSMQKQKWSGKWSFHAVITIFLLLRTIFFMIYPSFHDKRIIIPPSIMGLWEQLGDTCFLVAYLMLLLFWAQFYNQFLGKKDAMSGGRNLLRVIFVLCLIGFATMLILILLLPQKMEENWNKIETACGLFLSCVTLFLAGGFMYYAVKLWMILRTFLPASTRRRAQVRKIVSVGIFCTVAFTTRAIIVIITMVEAWKNPNVRSFSATIEMVILFFVFLEAVPIATMMFLLRKLPRIQDASPASVSAA
eukprot:TRINITY_DN6147_c0_g1_i1.p1 TRINITY_DN6147_c0_g1~~TRINITY_DN6147_c0_g1_i1.p1  ORF type:complete len:322 (-),score=79.72 TRINITY_DN6147_c0_g1_i1:131-1096(-)